MKLLSNRPSHATVVAYLALFVAVGTGGAYAVERITSKDVANNSLRSADLKNRRAVSGRDVKRDALTGKEIRESALDGAAIAPIAGVNDAGDCNPTSPAAVTCVTTSFTLERAGRVLAVATGGFYSEATSPTRALCELRVDGAQRPTGGVPGETVDHTASSATDGFARTLVTPDPLPPGTHTFALACAELAGDVRISTPTIAAIAISTGS